MPVVLDNSLVGRRVVVRYRRAARSAAGVSVAEPSATAPAATGHDDRPLSDVVGVLTELSEAWVGVTGRRGPIRIPREAVVVARPVAADRRQILELQRIAALGWRAEDTVDSHGWVLRANQGFTNRANAALPLVSAPRPIEAQLAEVLAFYADRGLPAQVLVPLPARGLLDAELARRCWTVVAPSIVLTRPLAGTAPASDADSAHRAGAAAPAATVLVERAVSDRWLSGHVPRVGEIRETAVALWQRHDRCRFVSIVQDGTDHTLAIARGTVDAGWLGVTNVRVAPEFRRRGLGGRLMQALFEWARNEQATGCYLQVEDDNLAAQALYGQLGFVEHHRYHYRRAPDPDGASS
ncbi:MAG: family N-acetyltransferase [Frankiales bacterium]|nr:family N-acetyltransferase [Frankiales bacterium]